jgi:xanthine dehydrogenase accessory factor
VSTQGSTYSKAGDLVLVEDPGKVHGLISGGCLEGDLAERAASCIASGESASVEYDLHGDDEVFGLGVGCDGKVRVYIQAMTPENGYQPFAGYVEALERDGFIDVQEFRIVRPARVLLLGAGADVCPLLDYGHWLGWSTVIVDHRPHYIDALELPVSCESICVPGEALASRVDVDRFDAAIVMSHNLASDRSYLCALADSAVPFVGLLGPPHRRDRLLGSIGDSASRLEGRLRAPVGREIGGRGPGAIALEIATEIHEYIVNEC